MIALTTASQEEVVPGEEAVRCSERGSVQEVHDVAGRVTRCVDRGEVESTELDHFNVHQHTRDKGEENIIFTFNKHSDKEKDCVYLRAS